MSLISDLRAKVAYHEGKVAYHRQQRDIFKAALTAASQEPSPPIATPRVPLIRTSPSAFILSLLSDHPGLKAGDIREQAAKADYTQDNFPYKQLSRLKRIGKITSEGSRYFLKEKASD